MNKNTLTGLGILENTKGWSQQEEDEKEDIDPNYGKDPRDSDSGYNYDKDFRSWF